jgi:hypothetical protein
MIERLTLRASNAVASSGDPFTTVKPDLIVGPIVRAFQSGYQRDYAEYYRQSITLLQLIGLVLNILLYGMQLMQVGTYFRSSPRFVSYFFGTLHSDAPSDR